MAIDPLAVLGHVQRRQEAPQPEPEPPPEPTPPPPPTAEPGPRAKGREKREVGAALRAQASAGWGVLPGVGAGVGGAAGLRLGAWRVELGGRYWFTRHAGLDDMPAAGGELRLGAGEVRGCGSPSVHKLEFPLCVGVEAGAMYGRGVGLAEQRSARRPWLGFSAGRTRR